MNERILCLDIGDARIGVAVSDMTRLIATPVQVIHRVGWGPDVKRICQLCDQYETRIVLSGLPLNMDGTAGFQTEKVKKFCEQLERAGLEVYYQDERLTTVTAEDALLEDNMSRADRKQNVDKVAAAIILQQYLDTLREETQESIQHEEESPMSEEMDNIVELVDEEGNTVRFEHLVTLEHEGNDYILLIEADGDDDEDAEVVIMQIMQDADGAEYYEALEDDNLYELLFQQYLDLLAEEENEDDGV